ncbi:MAG: response regulator [Pegethrix bostrychoides GSE-TBD4-15B]|jgi:DNA-binding response OmpR family regulator|uniref:Response regulator n=1 Tax=Pegethrix bostrychoides GSE-TBD4-15B TaxID=2839662 RepID=A0A951PAZ2_9CYAN|nr:response regulator [Pegethrix bostrychoides GSE-TBD4-15B]
MKILVIEDDELVARALKIILTSQNYAVEVVPNGQLGWDLIETFDYDLILLDVMMPQLDGISLCRQIRSKGFQMPILLLTRRDSSHDKAIGLDAGADDYVVKPFDPEELVARVRALLRRGGAVAQPVLEWGDLRLDPSSCEVTCGSTPLSLTPKEYALLELFLRNSRRVFSCGMILEHLWAYEEMPGEDAVRTHIKGLRQKLKAVGLPSDLVETVYGIGYRLKPDTADHQLSAQVSFQSHPPVSPQTLASINHIWQRFQPRVSQQVEILERAVSALEQSVLEQDLQQQARQEAHTLAGSLGLFGLPEGSQLAHCIEQQLQAEQPLAEATALRGWVKSLRQEIERSRADFETQAALAEDERQLLIINGDAQITQRLTSETAIWGLRATVAANITRARDKILLELPDIVILDPAIAPTLEASLSLLSELRQQVPPVPVIIWTEQCDLSERLQITRLGGRIFIPQSAPPAQVLEAVHQELHRADREKAGVMVVDDDPQLLAVVRALLTPWGFKVTTLAEPQQFWDVLEASSPDLLILDIAMPQISGIELCQVVRADARWSDLPILFVTAHTDAETVNQVFAVGADDFVSKPIVGSELVTRIVNRLERSRLSRQLAKLTQSALNHPTD